jgi:hypothetical protein
MRIFCIDTTSFAEPLRAREHEVLNVVLPGGAKSRFDIELDLFSNPQNAASILRMAVDAFQPDILLQGDSSRPLIHLELEKINVLKAWYAVDSHIHTWHRHYAPVFDHVFCAQKNKVDTMKSYQPNVEWLPLYCGRTSEFLPWSERIYPVSFVGKLDKKINRARCLLFDELLKRAIPLHAVSGDYVEVYKHSKIVINESVNDDLNLRFFEGPGCGALLISDRLTHSMSEILEPGVDYLLYEHGDADSLCAQIHWALSNECRALEMAGRAHKKIAASHTASARALQVEKRLEHLKQHGAAPDLTIAAHLAWAFTFCSRLSISEHLAEFFRDRASSYANKAVNIGNSWALLAKASVQFEEEKFISADCIVEQINTEEKDPEFRNEFLKMSCIIKIYTGQVEKARSLLDEAIREFPLDEGFNEIRRHVYV